MDSSGMESEWSEWLGGFTEDEVITIVGARVIFT